MEVSAKYPIQVLYITYDGLTDPLGQSQVLPYIKGLCKQGYEFTVLSFEKKERHKALSSTIQSLCNEDNIDWHPVTFHTTPPILAKVYDRWKMKALAIKLHTKKNFSFIHCRSYPASEVGLFFNKNYNIPFLFDMRGFWPDEKIDSGHWNISNPIYKQVYKHYKKQEFLFLSNAAHIISLTHAGKKELINVYGTRLSGLESKITVIPTCADLDLFNYNNITNAKKNELTSILNLQNRFVVSYSGSVGGWYLINEMLAFVKILKQLKPNLVFLCLTKEPPSAVIPFIEKNGLLQNDVIITFANRNELPLYLSLSDISIFFIRNTYSKISSSPTKYPELMGLGIPVICNDIGDTGFFVNETKSGILVNTFTEIEYEKAAQKFFNTAFQKEHIRNEALKYFNLQAAIEKYKSIYERVLINKSP